MYLLFTSPRSSWVPPPERICRLTYLWMHFHSLSPHWFLCYRKARSAILRKANALTSLSHGFKKDRSFRFHSRTSPLQQPPQITLYLSARIFPTNSVAIIKALVWFPER